MSQMSKDGADNMSYFPKRGIARGEEPVIDKDGVDSVGFKA